MSKVLVDRELLELLRNFTFLHDDGCAGALRGNIDKALAAQPAEAEGVEVVAYATPNEDGDWQLLFFDEKEAMLYVDEEPPAPLVLQSDHLAALSAVTAERDRLANAFGDCVNSLHAEMLQKYGGQLPEDMHPVTRRDYDRDMEEIAEYRAAMAAKEA